MSWDESWLEIHAQADEDEMVIDSGCFGHVLSTAVRTTIPCGWCFNVEAVAANDVALLHYGQKAVCNTRARVKTSGVRTLDDEQWQTSFDSDQV